MPQSAVQIGSSIGWIDGSLHTFSCSDCAFAAGQDFCHFRENYMEISLDKGLRLYYNLNGLIVLFVSRIGVEDMTRKKHVPALIAGVIFFLLIIIAVRLVSGGSTSTEENASAIAQGVAYLQSLESQDPDTVDNVLKQQRLQQLQALRDERLRQLESGEISVWSLFDDYVLLGDSRAVGFSFYGFLPEERVIAESGASISHLEEHIPDIVALNPSNIFLCYGLNDLVSEIWATPEDYAQKMSDLISQIHAQLPDANVFVSSILPAPGSAGQSKIPDYNSALSAMCATVSHCYFVDNSSTAEEYSDLWEPDGIHVQMSFYPHWASNLITEVYSASLGEDDSASGSSDANTSSDTADNTNSAS